MNTKLLLSLGLAASVVAGLFYVYFLYSQSKLAELNRIVAEQTVQIEAFAAALTQMKEDAELTKKITDDVNEALARARADAAEQRRDINEHDLGEIGKSKPKVLEDRANKATRDLFKRLEDLSK